MSRFSEWRTVTFVSFSIMIRYQRITVNVKDAMGNYFGDQQAYLRRNIDGWSVIWSFVSDHEDCIEATQKMLSKSRSE